MTVRNALRLLQDEGLITAEHGRGVYVRSRPPVRRLASDRFAQRHRKEGKAAFTVESEQVGATPLVDRIKVTESRAPDDTDLPRQDLGTYQADGSRADDHPSAVNSDR